MFYRHHTGGVEGAPTLLLLHGWTASADLQWYNAYEGLGERYPFVAIDHRGHGRGIRSTDPFQLEACADDAMALVASLGIERVIPVGYSMGGPISLLTWQRHPQHVQGLVLAATAMAWQSTRRDRAAWALLPVGESLLRSRMISTAVSQWTKRMERAVPVAEPQWVQDELRRSDPRALTDAGRALRHFDARPWASSVDVPSAFVVTTKDRLVPPVRQRALAAALRAEVVELPGDHSCTFAQDTAFVDRLRQAVDKVATAD